MLFRVGRNCFVIRSHLEMLSNFLNQFTPNLTANLLTSSAISRIGKFLEAAPIKRLNPVDANIVIMQNQKEL